VVAVPLLVVLVGWGPGWLFAAFVLALILCAQWELYRMFAGVGVRAYRGAGFLCGALVGLAFAVGTPGREWLVPLALSLAVAGCLTVGVMHSGRPEFDWAAVALTLLGVCYCGWLLGHALWLQDRPGGRRLTLFLLAVTWSGETAAYVVGRRWGRVRLAPRVSPAKTVEGAVAQGLVSLAVGVALASWTGLGPRHAPAAALLLGVAGQVGDLAESFLKRSAGTKDAGGLLPGHGGLLDRLDSLLFNVPALYYYVTLSGVSVS
jgi:phosphatidate cytidylyltransferase